MTLNTHTHTIFFCPASDVQLSRGLVRVLINSRLFVCYEEMCTADLGLVVYDAMLLHRWFRRFGGKFALTLSLQGARKEQIPLWHLDYWRSRWKVSSKRREKLSQWQRHSPEYLPFQKQKCKNPKSRSFRLLLHTVLIFTNRERAISLTTHSLWKYHMTQPLLLVVSSRHTNFLHEKILL